MRNKDKKDEPEPILTPGRIFEDVIFEQLADGSFLIYDRISGQVSTQRLVVEEGLGYVPLPRLPWPAASLPEYHDPSGEEPKTKEQLIEACRSQRFQGEYETEEQLFNEVRAFFEEHLDVPNELLFDVYTCYVLASWRAEDFSVIPYAFFLGPLASGKTRALECFHRVCYRSIMAASMSAASLFRTLEAWHPTLLLDETEIYNREAMVEVLALLNSGYRKGQYAIRIEKVEEGCPQIAMFDTFGFKILAGTEELAATLQSRCIITRMSKAVKHIGLFMNESKASELRNKLLMYRFKNLGKKLDFDVSNLNGYFNNSRIIELFVSLLHVAPTQGIRERLIDCMKQLTQSRLDEEQASIEARVFDAVLKCEDQVVTGKLSTQTITEVFNRGLPEKEQATSRFIGRKVAGLGFEKCKLSGGGHAGFFWDKVLIERLTARYYPTPSKTTPQTPHSPQSMEAYLTQDSNPGESGETSQELTASEEHEKTIKSGECRGNRESGVELEALAKNTLRLERLTGRFEDKCLACGSAGQMGWQLNQHDGSWGLLCEGCGLELEKRLSQP